MSNASGHHVLRIAGQASKSLRDIKGRGDLTVLCTMEADGVKVRAQVNLIGQSFVATEIMPFESSERDIFFACVRITNAINRSIESYLSAEKSATVCDG